MVLHSKGVELSILTQRNTLLEQPQLYKKRKTNQIVNCPQTVTYYILKPNQSHVRPVELKFYAKRFVSIYFEICIGFVPAFILACYEQRLYVERHCVLSARCARELWLSNSVVWGNKFR